MNKHIQLYFRPQTVLLSLYIVTTLILAGCAEKNKPAVPPKIYHVGIINGIEFFAPTADGFKAKMTELGYIEGKNITYDIQKIQYNPVSEESAIRKLISDKVDMIFVFPTEAAIKAKELTRGMEIPVIFANANIEDVNLVDSVPNPGENITGVRYPGPDLAIKRLEIIMELLPNCKKILIAYQRNYPIVLSQLRALHPVSASAGIELVELPASNAAELKKELTDLKMEDIDAIIMIAEPLMVNPDAFKVIGMFADKHRIPIGGAIMQVDGYESIFGVSTDHFNVGKQAAVLADQIFKGTAAGNISVISAESYLQINYSAAKKRGIKIGEGLLSQANEIIR